LVPKVNGGMGFWDMRLFNKALFARQAWTLIQFPDNLCSRLLKAKYYPNRDLVNTEFPGDASPTWKSIEHGLDLLKEGINWWVDSGSKIQIWRDPWTAGSPSRKLNLKRGRSQLRWVFQLMIPGGREWDVQLLKSILYSHDVDEVLKIRLSNRVSEDHIAWLYENSGIFSVSSTYHLAMLLDGQNQDKVGCSSRTDGGRPIFNKIWSAVVPSKVQIFAWRLSQEALATQANKKNRTLERDATC
jgi:hypothetical protein